MEQEKSWQELFNKPTEATTETTAAVTETGTTEPVVTTTETVAAEVVTTEAPAETQTQEQVKRTFIDVVKETPTEVDPKEKELEAKILEKYKDKFSVLSKLEQSEALKYVVENWDEIDHESMFAKDKTDYSKLTPFDIHLEVAKQNGIQISPEDLAVEKETFEEKLEGMTPVERELYKKELLAKLPHPKDNSTYLEKEKERKAVLAQENAAKQKQQEEYWAAKEQYAMQIKDKLIGVEVEGTGVVIDQAIVDNVYGKLAKSWGSPRYFDEKGDYRPELEIEDLVYAEIGRNASKIREEAIKEGRIKALEERTNASQDSTSVATTAANNLSPEKLKLRNDIYFAYGKDKDALAAALKEAGLA